MCLVPRILYHLAVPANYTVLAYGVTGSGKTYTMFGPDYNLRIGFVYQTISQIIKNGHDTSLSFY